MASITCYICQDLVTDHTTKTCPNQKCRQCGRLGHVTKTCPQLMQNTPTPNFAPKNPGYFIFQYPFSRNFTRFFLTILF